MKTKLNNTNSRKDSWKSVVKRTSSSSAEGSELTESHCTATGQKVRECSIWNASSKREEGIKKGSAVLSWHLNLFAPKLKAHSLTLFRERISAKQPPCGHPPPQRHDTTPSFTYSIALGQVLIINTPDMRMCVWLYCVIISILCFALGY